MNRNEPVQLHSIFTDLVFGDFNLRNIARDQVPHFHWLRFNEKFRHQALAGGPLGGTPPLPECVQEIQGHSVSLCL